MWDLQCDLDIAADVQEKSLAWTKHLVRMNHGKVVTKIFYSKLEKGGRRRRGRPRLRWSEDVQNDLGDMKDKRWRHTAVNREKSESVIQVAKALRGPYSE